VSAKKDSLADNAANLARLVAVGYSVRDAAKELGISERTAYRISAPDDFKKSVSVIRTEKTESLSAKALGAAERAIVRLDQLMSTAEKESDQISACRLIISQVLPLAENTELRRRIDELEQRATQEAEGVGVGKSGDGA
jgi:predicted transcriptional regulator